tara:strand:- start:6638 stop:7105 length:468 start_codon:yes stop_codon:yes gene_type:complete
MKNKLTLLFSTVSLFSIGQNIILNENSGISSSYSIADIKKITFMSGDMVIETESSTDDFSISSVRNLVFDQIITETEELEQLVQELYAYPNPCGDVINIIQNITDARYFIYDLNGSLIQSDKASAKINVSNLKTGIYFFTLVGETSTQTLKILKK